MLSLIYNGTATPIQDTEYYVRQLSSGFDEVIFSISIHDPAYRILAEEMQIVDRAGQTYLVKQIDSGITTAKIICALDLDDWKAAMYRNWGSGSNTLEGTVNEVKPAGWTVVDLSGSHIRRTISGNLTPLEIIKECAKVYSIYPRWDNKARTITLYPTTMQEPVGAFATKELNLQELNYKGKSTDFATRLYAVGKDGMTFASINDGKAYVEDHRYSDKVISAYWEDQRYTIPENLMADAQAKLAAMAIPSRSYDCRIVDLKAVDPEKYARFDFSLLTTATLIDTIKNTSINYQVVERHEYPYHPELNKVIFNTSPKTITSDILTVSGEVLDPNSDFNQNMTDRIKTATDWLTSGDGYILCVLNQAGAWQELLFLDQPAVELATKVLRINQNGIGFASGAAGTFSSWTYNQAWTLDGKLSLGGVNNAFGQLILNDDANPVKAIIKMDNAGLRLYNSSGNKVIAELAHSGLQLDYYTSQGLNTGSAWLDGQGLSILESGSNAAGADIAAGQITVTDTGGDSSMLTGSELSVAGVTITDSTVDAPTVITNDLQVGGIEANGETGQDTTISAGGFDMTFNCGVLTDVSGSAEPDGYTGNAMLEGDIYVFENGRLIEIQ